VSKKIYFPKWQFSSVLGENIVKKLNPTMLPEPIFGACMTILGAGKLLDAFSHPPFPC